MRLAIGGDDAFGCFCDHGADERGGIGLEVDDVDDEGVEIRFHVE